MKYEAIVQTRVVRWPWIVFAAAAVALLFLPIGHDAIWQMWIGRHLWHGAEFGRDIIEVNPPLWFWIAAPLAGLGEALGVSADYLVRVLMIASIGLSLYLIPNRYRLPALAAFAVLPLIDFGQREHFAFVSSAPYAFLIARRVKGEPPTHPLLIGLFAALGFALKPYFVFVPIALELLAWRSPRLRPETIALGVCALLYTGAVLIFARAWLVEVVPMVVAYYPYFQGVQNYKALDFAVLLGLLGAVVGWRKGSPETRALALTALAFVPAVMIQAKGWSYQSIPVRGFLFLAIVAELMRERKNPFADSILFGAALLSFWPVGIYENERIPEASEHLKDLKPGTSVIALASNPSFAWPTVETYHLKWASKQFSYWQMSAVMKTKDRNYVPNVRRVIQADLARKPDIVIADRRPYVTWVFDAAIPSLPGYRLRRHTKWIDSYERVQ